MHRMSLTVFSLIVIALAIVASVGSATAFAQFGPPSTIFGSITDASGTVPEGQTIEAYIGDKVCGKGQTQFTGDGAARVTVYFADVVSREQTAGCGSENLDIRVKVGNRFATQTAKWRAGPVQLDLTFGNATPAPIPTFTPAPTRTPSTASTSPAGTTVPAATQTQSTSGVLGTGTPGQTSSSPAAAPSGTATLAGGLRTKTPTAPGSSGGDGDEGGFPVWGIVVMVLGAVGVVGGAVGILMARSRRANEDPADPHFTGPRD